MQFIKKLVILTGGNSRGTLILEKNSFGVWCRLNIFGEPLGRCRLVVMAGDELFVMQIEPNKSSVKFELGELDYEQIHVAVIDDKVIMYGSNCAVKLSADDVLSKVKRRDETALKQSSYITFSGANQKIDDFFKEIVPPEYNDFAIADKNFYPAYVSIVEQSDENADKKTAEGASGNQEGVEEGMVQESDEKLIESEKTSDVAVTQARDDEKDAVGQRVMPHTLERQYLSLFAEGLAAKSAIEKKERKEADEKEAGVQKEQAVRAERKALKSFATASQHNCGRQATYFERSSEQIERLIAANERYGAVERLIPGSKFVRINYDQKRFYIVGVIGKDYICYGVPGVFSAMPPEPLKGYAKWLPLGRDKAGGEGFWMMYQDGITGETLKN